MPIVTCLPSPKNTAIVHKPSASSLAFDRRHRHGRSVLRTPVRESCYRKTYGHDDVHAFFKHRNLWLKGRYRLTLDWYEGNDLLHLITLENGQLAFLPHHKLKFGDHPEGFEPYRKLRAEWKVPRP